MQLRFAVATSCWHTCIPLPSPPLLPCNWPLFACAQRCLQSFGLAWCLSSSLNPLPVVCCCLLPTRWWTPCARMRRQPWKLWTQLQLVVCRPHLLASPGNASAHRLTTRQVRRPEAGNAEQAWGPWDGQRGVLVGQATLGVQQCGRCGRCGSWMKLHSSSWYVLQVPSGPGHGLSPAGFCRPCLLQLQHGCPRCSVCACSTACVVTCTVVACMYMLY